MNGFGVGVDLAAERHPEAGRKTAAGTASWYACAFRDDSGGILVRLCPTSPGAPVATFSAAHPLDGSARPEPDLDLRDLELVHANGTQNPRQPLPNPVHAGGAAVPAGTHDSSKPVPAIAR